MEVGPMTWQPELWSGHSTNVAEADQAEQMHSKPTQRGSILIYLQAGNAITDIEALRLFQCRRLAARILELKRMGHQVQSRMITLMSGKRVAEYWI
jgi:GTP cyclohydrolase II